MNDTNLRKQAEESLSVDIFGRYCLLETLGRGGMASIFRARTFETENLDAFLVIKRILPNLAADESFISMFIDEATITVRLNHPNICQLYELGRLNGSYFMVMEYIAGKDLLAFQNHFRKSGTTMQPRQAAYIVSEICKGLDYAHQKEGEDGKPLEIVHRDISPQNVIVSFHGNVKIIDFGIARARDRRQQTEVGVLKGKFGYMSPEQVRAGDIDGQSDVFAAGIMLWELLTNRRLFYSKNSAEILHMVQNKQIPNPSEVIAGIPPELDTITQKALRRDRKYRYNTAGEFAEDLTRWLHRHTVPYGQEQLAQWTCVNFADALALEREKRRVFAKFRTRDDVFDYQSEHGVPFDDDGNPRRQHLSAERFEQYRSEVTSQSQVEDVLAEGAPDSVVAVGSDRSVGALPDVPVSANTDQGRTRSSLWLLLFAVVLFASGFLAAETIGLPFIASSKAVSVELSPAEASLRLDGEPLNVVDGQARVSLKPGRYTLEAQAPGYAPSTQTFTVRANGDNETSVALEPEAPERFTIKLPELAVEGTRVFVNGAEADIEGNEASFMQSPADDAFVEIAVPGYFMVREELSLLDGDTFSVAPGRFERVAGALELQSSPEAEVVLNGEAVGDTSDSLQLTELEPFRVHELTFETSRPGFQSMSQDIVFEGAYDRNVSVSIPRIGREKPAETEYGFLTVTGSPQDWYALAVDGREIGLRTPFEDVELPLTTGEKSLEFRRGGQVWSTSIVVEEGDTQQIELPLPEMPAEPSSSD